MTRIDRSAGKSGYVTDDEFMRAAESEFGPEYFQYWLVYLGRAPQVCPKCQSHNIKMIHLGLPNDRVDGKIWAKWYLWCDSCLYGIYCPPGSYRIPVGDPYILWGDEKALKENLPEGLKLITPANLGRRPIER